MLRFAARRLLQAGVVVLAVVALTFLLLHLAPGNPLQQSLEDNMLSEAARAKLLAAYGLDRPLGEQLARYLAGVARGELGWSFSLHEPVRDTLARTLPNTLLLMGLALGLSFLLGILAGVYQGARRGRPGDRVLGGVLLLFFSLPEFWVATLVLLTLAHWLPLFPATGAVDPVMHDYLGPGGRVLDRLQHLALPVLAQTLVTTAAVARQQRGALLGALGEDFVRTARAKGVPERLVLYRHALRNALLPVLTLVGLALPALLGGTVFVEQVFAWPGIGLLALNAVGARDYPLVLAVTLVGSALVVLGGALADLLHALADPRLRAR